MTPLSHKTLRRGAFSTFVVFAVVFCFFVVRSARREVDMAGDYAKREKAYLQKLLAAGRTLDECRVAVSFFSCGRSHAAAEVVHESVEDLSRALNGLSKADVKRGRRSGMVPLDSLSRAAKEMLSASSALMVDLKSGADDRGELLRQDLNLLTGRLEFIAERYRLLLSHELDHIDLWRRQSQFFFDRLWPMLIIFFLVTIGFSIFASRLLASALARQLRQLSEGTRQLSRGNLKYRFHGIKNDDVSKVKYDFNLMALRLERQNEALRSANLALRVRTEELIEANQHKDRFLANMSHELRTPLNSVIGFSELMIERAERLPAERVVKYSERILVAAEHLLDLISDLLRIAKFDAGVMEVEFSNQDLAVVLDEIVAMMQPLADRRRLSLSLECPGELPLSADRRLLRQVFINLINNALKFTPAGGVTVTAAADGRWRRIDVADTGIGISAADQKLIFKDFHRVEDSLTANYDGAGLGLTLSKRLVELHGGSITVSSELGEGSVFSVLLPVDGPKSGSRKGDDKDE